MKYAVVKYDMSNIIAWSVSTREDLANNCECEIVSWHRTKAEAKKSCPRYIIDKHA